MPKYIEKAEKLTLPVIPTRGLVAFPSIPLNFEVERDFSVAATRSLTGTTPSAPTCRESSG